MSGSFGHVVVMNLSEPRYEGLGVTNEGKWWHRMSCSRGYLDENLISSPIYASLYHIP